METLFGNESTTRQRSWRFWLFVLSPILLLATCSVLVVKGVVEIKPAQEQAAILHEHLEAGEYAAIYMAASTEFQRQQHFEATEQFLRAIHDKVGSCLPPAKATRSFASSTPSGTTVLLQYRLKCSNGLLDEMMTFSVKGGTPKLLHYEASSPFLPK
jgi:hypothetical protein